MEQKSEKNMEQALYALGTEPQLVTVPAMTFLMIDGTGAPEGADYRNGLERLYGISAAIQMGLDCGQSQGGMPVPAFPPPECLWTLGESGFDPDRNRWRWTLMVRQPDSVGQENLDRACKALAKEALKGSLEDVRLELYEEGLCVQLMHVGSYAEEQNSIDRIWGFIREKGLRDRVPGEMRHHEIYLSDPSKTPPEALQTVLRHPVVRITGEDRPR